MSALDTLRAALFGNPPQSSYKPSREGVLSAFTQLVLSVEAGVIGVRSYSDISARNADTANQPVGTIGYIYNNNNSASDDANGFYQRVGSSWVRAEWFETLIESAVDKYVQPFSFGNFLDTLSPFGNEASGGASLVGDFGVSIPSGSTGNGSFVRPRWEKDFSDHTGDVAIIKIEAHKSATFTRVLQGVMQVSTASSTFVTRMDEPGTFYTTEVVGDRSVFTFRYVIQGDETAIQPYVVIATSPNTSSVETFEITGLSFAFASISDPFQNAAEQNIELLKTDVLLDATRSFQSGTGNIIDQIGDFGSAVANGATITGKFEITVPSGDTGAGSFLRTRWEKDFSDYVGAQVEVKIRVSKNSPFTRELVPTFQLSTALNPFVVRTADLTSRKDDNEIVYSYLYTIQGDEVAFNPYVSVNPGQTLDAASNEIFALTGFSVSLISNNDLFETPADYNADLVKDDVLNEAYRFTILRPTFADVITVKPSGGHFTTLSDAIAAITDASVRRQHKIAWSAGALIGTPDFHIPEFTAIVCQDPTDDAILSFTNANNASGAIISNTSLAWIDRDGVVIDGGTWRIKNGRYVFHWETNGNYPDTHQSLVNVVAEHLGNAEAINNTWGPASQVALGIGVSGGQVLDIHECRLNGVGGGLLAHSPANIDWSTAFKIDIENCRLTATDPAYSDITVKPIRRGPGRVIVSRSSFDSLTYTDAEWIGGDPGSGVNTAQIQVTVSGISNLSGDGVPIFDNAITLGASVGADYTWFLAS